MTGYSFRLTGNRKVGPIPVTRSPQKNCPESCAFKGRGCYAENAPLVWAWQKDHLPWEEVLWNIRRLSKGQLWRHNEAGDLPGVSPFHIHPGAIDELILANKGKRGFTYTHYPDTEHNIAAIRHANDNGFTINLSANDLDHAVRLAKHGLPMTTLVPVDWGTKTVMHGGLKIVTCPATYIDEVTCATCKLCAVSTRDCVVAFPAHGSRKNKVTAQIIARSGTGQAA